MRCKAPSLLFLLAPQLVFCTLWRMWLWMSVYVQWGPNLRVGWHEKTSQELFTCSMGQNSYNGGRKPCQPRRMLDFMTSQAILTISLPSRTCALEHVSRIWIRSTPVLWSPSEPYADLGISTWHADCIVCAVSQSVTSTQALVADVAETLLPWSLLARGPYSFS